MVTILIIGFNNSFDKADFINYLKAKHGHSIKSAKDCVDMILAGESVLLSFEDIEIAQQELSTTGISYNAL